MRRPVRRVALGGVLVLVCSVGVAAFAAPSLTAISTAASASALADRVAPPTTSRSGPNGISPTIGGCSIFPSDSPWNMRIDGLPVRAGSAQMIAGLSGNLHADFGAVFGIPYAVVPANQPLVPIGFRGNGANESDPGPYPIPSNAPIEAGSDGHVLVLQQGICRLFELDQGVAQGTGWLASWGAEFDLSSNALRPLGWTSADAAGLPILAGLVRYDEVAAGRVDHAIRVTFSKTQRGYILPATHFASADTNPNLPPMGLRMRMRADVDISGLHGQALIVATAMKQYGFIVADNGSNWFFQGDPNPGWNNDDLNQLKSIPGSAFEVVDTGAVHS
jgi:hypothetical protein